MKRIKLYCYSKNDFDEVCRLNSWDDNNIPEDCAFISICGTEDCQEYYLKESEPHYFKNCHHNVLNLNFDDIPKNTLKWKGITFYGLSLDQAEDIVNFVHNNLGKNFYIHCRAGKSRSQGVIRYILDSFPDYDFEERPENPCTTPNYDVTSKLKQIERNRK